MPIHHQCSRAKGSGVCTAALLATRIAICIDSQHVVLGASGCDAEMPDLAWGICLLSCYVLECRAEGCKNIQPRATKSELFNSSRKKKKETCGRVVGSFIGKLFPLGVWSLLKLGLGCCYNREFLNGTVKEPN